MTTTLIVPARFWEDHLDRGCRCGDECPDREAHEREGYGQLTTKGYRVTLNEADLLELKSDAIHHIVMGVGAYGRDLIGLISSARATVSRIEKVTL